MIHDVFMDNVFKNFPDDRCETDGAIVCRVSPVTVLKRGVTFAQSQSSGRVAVFNDWVKRTWRIGAMVGAQDLRMRAGIWSGPVDLFVSSLCSSFVMPFVDMSREGIWG